MFERFTDRARKVMQLANQEAQRFNHEYIGTEHILLGLVKEGSGVAANVLKNLDVDLRKIRLEVEKLVQSGPEMVTIGKLPQTPRAKKVIEYSMEEARNLNHNYVGTEHILLGLLREQEGVAAQVLMNLGLKLEDVREEVLNLLGHGMESGEGTERGGREGTSTAAGGEPTGSTKGSKSKTPALDSFGRDLTELAKQGKLDPVIGRGREIERAIQVLCRRTKNNPVLLGEAGVGKTAIVEGFAQRVVNGDVPEILADKRIVVLDLAMMVAVLMRAVRSRMVKSAPAVVGVLPLREIWITPTALPSASSGTLMIFWMGCLSALGALGSGFSRLIDSNTVGCFCAGKLLIISGRFSRTVRAASELVVLSGMLPAVFSFGG